MLNQISQFGELKIVTTAGHRQLGLDVCQELGVEPMAFTDELFPNREWNIRRLEPANNLDIFIITSLHSWFNTIKELRLMASKLVRANRLTAICTFVCDGKGDWSKKPGQAVAFKDTAKEISSAGIDNLVVFDLHSKQHLLAFDTDNYQLNDISHLFFRRELVQLFSKSHFDAMLAVDPNALNITRLVAKILKIPKVAEIDKWRHPETRIVDGGKSELYGHDIDGCDVLIIDDMMQGGTSAGEAAIKAKACGAKTVTIGIVHPDINPETHNIIGPLLADRTIDNLTVVDTIPLDADPCLNHQLWLSHPNFHIYRPIKFLADIIGRIHRNEPMEDLYLDLYADE